jgi:WD40 repeat protein
MTVVIFSVSTRSEKFRLEDHKDAIMWVRASPDGTLLATSSWDSTVKIWDLQDGSLVRELKGTKGQSWTGSWRAPMASCLLFAMEIRLFGFGISFKARQYMFSVKDGTCSQDGFQV